MSAQSVPITTTGQTDLIPRQTLAVFADYFGAQALVDRLSDAGFPVQTLQITGIGLSAVEHVTGRLTTGRAALRGALSGVWFGLLFTLLFALFVPGPAVGLLIGAPLIAAVWGAVFGSVGHLASRGQRDFSSVSGFAADRFEVTVAASDADEARRLAA